MTKKYRLYAAFSVFLLLQLSNFRVALLMKTAGDLLQKLHSLMYSCIHKKIIEKRLAFFKKCVIIAYISK